MLQAAPSDGIGPDEVVQQANPETEKMLWKAILVLIGTVAVLWGGHNIKAAADNSHWPWVTILVLVLVAAAEAFGWYNVYLLNYVSTVQRPESKVRLHGVAGCTPPQCLHAG